MWLCINAPLHTTKLEHMKVGSSKGAFKASMLSMFTSVRRFGEDIFTKISFERFWDIWGCMWWLVQRALFDVLSTWGHLTYEPRVVTMKLWEPEKECPKAVPRHFQNHVVWSQALKCSVKSYVIGPSTKCYSMSFYSCGVFTHDEIELINGCECLECHVLC